MTRTWTVRRIRSGIARTAAPPEHAAFWRCPECDEPWLPEDGRRWKAYATADAEVVVFCPDCAEREFGNA